MLPFWATTIRDHYRTEAIFAETHGPKLCMWEPDWISTKSMTDFRCQDRRLYGTCSLIPNKVYAEPPSPNPAVFWSASWMYWRLEAMIAVAEICRNQHYFHLPIVRESTTSGRVNSVNHRSFRPTGLQSWSIHSRFWATYLGPNGILDECPGYKPPFSSRIFQPCLMTPAIMGYPSACPMWPPRIPCNRWRHCHQHPRPGARGKSHDTTGGALNSWVVNNLGITHS